MTAMSTHWRPIAGGLLVVTVAVVGLLSMHGLDGVVVSLREPTQAGHGSTGDSSEHETLGLCVFVAAIAGLGIATTGLSRRSATI